MSDNLVKRLRATCSCNIDNTPCLAEEECRVAQDAADRIEELEANINIKADFIDATINQLAASDQRIDELEAKLAKAVEALGGMIGLFSVDNVLRKGTHLNIELSHARTTLAKLTKERSDEI
jgi:uncharacterized coiled-coil protein SlyX